MVIFKCLRNMARFLLVAAMVTCHVGRSQAFFIPVSKSVASNGGTTRALHGSLLNHPESLSKDDFLEEDNNNNQQKDVKIDFSSSPSESIEKWALPASLLLLSTTVCTPAEAAAGPIPAALWSYGHYLSMLTVMGASVAERFIIKSEMTLEEEGSLRTCHLINTAGVVLLALTGYFRLGGDAMGKGAAFYSHEWLFWVKMSFVGVLAGLTAFPSITFLKRGSGGGGGGGGGSFVPMNEALVARFVKVINAQITAVLSIPLFATFMARGVSYDGSSSFVIPLGVVLVVLATAGSSLYYGKEAFTLTADDKEQKPTET